MKQPIRFIYRNLVFGSNWDDCWAVYRLSTYSYAGLTMAGKRELFSLLSAFAYTLEADFTLLRVARPWSLFDYATGVEATADERHVDRARLGEYLDRQREQLDVRGSQTPEVYVSVRIGEPPRADEVLRSPGLASAHRWLGLRDPRGISRRRLESLLAEAAKVEHQILDYLDCEAAASNQLQWLIRRSFCRAVGNPSIDEHFQPQALIVDDGEPSGDARYKPLEVDLLRLLDAPINVERRALRIESERGDSYQAFLCVGALPEVVSFPGRRAELMFAPLEALDFPVDVAFSSGHVPNGDSVRLVRRRIVDADQIYREESSGDHGPTANTFERPQIARELEQYLTGGDHPPLLKATISYCVSATSEEQLEQRIERLRRELGSIDLHRPLGDQLRLFVSHLPGKAAQISDYADYLTVEQLGAMVPVATHAVGASSGPYIGHTLTGARQPVLFDPTEASRTSRAPATLLSGTLGSGKTLCMELIMYQAFLAGSTICDIDPKGDHRLEALPGLAEQMEKIELSAHEDYRGVLDPLRIAAEETREDLTYNFLLAILPDPVAPEWQTEVRLAVQRVIDMGGRSCGEVIDELARSNEAAREVARVLRIHANSGLAKLGIATAESDPPEAGSRPITSLRIRNLTLPLPGTSRADQLEEERIGQAILHLLAVYALRLTSADPERHSVLGFDEAWVLLSDGAGRALVDRISRLGRAQNVTPLLATQVLGDVDELDGLIGAAFCFGVESEIEARKALRLLHLDEEDEALRQRLISFRQGRCMMRDFDGRVSPVQIDLLDPGLLEALDTTPRAAAALASANGSGSH
jgi:hypothetical protein